MATDEDSKQVSYPGHGVGLRNVGSYQVSGEPFLTGSAISTGEEVGVNFPFVTRSVTIINSGSAKLRVHFNSTSSGNVISGRHYITLDGDDENVTFNVKCKNVYVTCPSDGDGSTTGFECFAELTNIPDRRMYDLTGSGLTE
jgi:hypothetical protein|tara:strand:+ start:1236 stop:1661 length:426 start_codon:yes stop_codon:yes gene_type:complete